MYDFHCYTQKSLPERPVPQSARQVKARFVHLQQDHAGYPMQVSPRALPGRNDRKRAGLHSRAPLVRNSNIYVYALSYIHFITSAAPWRGAEADTWDVPTGMLTKLSAFSLPAAAADAEAPARVRR